MLKIARNLHQNSSILICINEKQIWYEEGSEGTLGSPQNTEL
jgi:hypothetical protein